MTGNTEHVAILGAGTMGRGIAHAAAVVGHDVTMRDVDEDVLVAAAEAVDGTISGAVERDKLDADTAAAARERVRTTTDLDDCADASIVIEAVPEDLDLKTSVLDEAVAAVGEDALITSNTSSLPVTELAASLDDPSRFCGLHFFNPAYVMGLVEVVTAEQTSDTAREHAVRFVESLEKEAVVVRDAPGFASSRLGVTLGAEAMRMLETGAAATADIDAAMELGYRHPMGPLELSDVVGLDVRLDILEHLREELGERFRPPEILRRKVRAGHLGQKSGRGFYVWEDGEAVRPVDEA
ncbi:3-hydroxyacyl-CoA dehydrogenase family protein [Haloglomus litoreum]|uniref:3-hydroxyacyl-CoA dehydrogenase family protein n=1 Tax=Haloglomus litoreum TaxID=3034026 RepID=UPI0023E8B168|nr:3-hydroxyacyl-CoA dehydrogenase family protein [Haloglomus sp. DT116]